LKLQSWGSFSPAGFLEAECSNLLLQWQDHPEEHMPISLEQEAFAGLL
jgi:hypothetical protein